MEALSASDAHGELVFRCFGKPTVCRWLPRLLHTHVAGKLHSREVASTLRVLAPASLGDGGTGDNAAAPFSGQSFCWSASCPHGHVPPDDSLAIDTGGDFLRLIHSAELTGTGRTLLEELSDAFGFRDPAAQGLRLCGVESQGQPSAPMVELRFSSGGLCSACERSAVGRAEPTGSLTVHLHGVPPAPGIPTLVAQLQAQWPLLRGLCAATEAQYRLVQNLDPDSTVVQFPASPSPSQPQAVATTVAFTPVRLATVWHATQFHPDDWRQAWRLFNRGTPRFLIGLQRPEVQADGAGGVTDAAWDNYFVDYFAGYTELPPIYMAVVGALEADPMRVSLELLRGDPRAKVQPCRHGDLCPTLQTACPLRHGGPEKVSEACRAGESCRQKSWCKYLHRGECPLGERCPRRALCAGLWRPFCPHAHPGEPLRGYQGPDLGFGTSQS